MKKMIFKVLCLVVTLGLPAFGFAVSSVEMAKTGRKEPLEAVQQPDEPEAPILMVAEVMPKFDGGDLNAFRVWVEKRIAGSADVDGMVVVAFVIETDGALGRIEVLQTPSEQLAGEVVRVLNDSPLWTPAQTAGRNVRVRFVMPVKF